MDPLASYLISLGQHKASGAALPEPSGYTPLANLLNIVGAELKPKVIAIIQLRNSGAGFPDGGFFTPDQLRGSVEDEPFHGANPSRGVIEVKPVDEDIKTLIPTKQVQDYLNHYGLVLLTNYRCFQLLSRDQQGRTILGERFSLAETAGGFWELVAQPQKANTMFGSRLRDYLKRVMLHAAPLESPKEVAYVLASYAREARHRVEEAPLNALSTLRSSLEAALGITVETDRGMHFFQSTLVQTLFYGVFSAWVLWHREQPGREDVFNWKNAAFSLQLPVLRKLFHELTDPAHVQALNVRQPLDWASDSLNRVTRPIFFQRFAEEDAVQYFYEPFLEAFDPKLREDFGVWYTPPEIIQYMVGRIDRLLREQFSLPGGFADPAVIVLDPCCGTGGYLIEVLRIVYKYHREEQGLGDLAAFEAKKAAQHRLFGFELLPAPYVVCHLQLDLLLQRLGAPFEEGNGERASVYLTNALTGWVPRQDPKQLVFAELEAERDAANKVKQGKRILVILGNPPYDGFGGVAVLEERDLTGAYRTVQKVGCPQPSGQGLNDLYIRFYRMAERQIVEKTGKGIISYISNYSWLDGLSHPGMREHYIKTFNEIMVDCLNGDKYKTGKVTPLGDPDPSVFSTDFNREGIQVGTAIVTLIKKPDDAADGGALIKFRHFWGRNKRTDLVASLEQGHGPEYEDINPIAQLGFPLVPLSAGVSYLTWPEIPALLPYFFPGVQTKRDDLVVAVEREVLVRRMGRYFDGGVSNEQIASECPRAMKATQRFDPLSVRQYLINRGFLPQYIVPFSYRPFDVRWIYWEPETRLVGEKVAAYYPHAFEGNLALVSQQKPRRKWSRPQAISALGCLDLVDRGASCFPLKVRADALPTASSLFSEGTSVIPNLTDQAVQYLRQLDAPDELLFFHIVAILHAPHYCIENEDALGHNWPRVPLPAAKSILEGSAALGQNVAALLNPKATVSGVTTGAIREDLRQIASFRGSNLEVNMGWGISGKDGAVMPGSGHINQVQRPSENVGPWENWIEVYLNESAHWQYIPEAVWDYELGGYQVLKKWLSYRERSILGRSLMANEAGEFTCIARRIAALSMLRDRLDENYETTKVTAISLPIAQHLPK